MWKINEKISKFANEASKITKEDKPAIQTLLQKYGIKDYNFEIMDKDIPLPNGRVTTYRLKTVTPDGRMHFYIVTIGPRGAIAMNEYDLIAQGWGWNKVKINSLEPQYEVRYNDGPKQGMFSFR